MADRKEQIILEFEIDRDEAIKDLDRVEKALLNAKKQQQELNKSFKEGKITEDQYIKSNRELQSVIKRETEQKKILNQVLDVESNSRNAMRQRVSALTKEYNNLNLSTAAGIKRSDELQKELATLNAELNKGSKAAGSFKDNIGNYPEQFGKAVDSVKPFGVSVSDAGSSLDKFTNPVAAAVAGLSALTAVYLSSSAGAKDLAFAQDRLTFITSSFAESLGTLVGGTGEGGQGLVNGLLDGIINLTKNIPGFSLALLALQKTTGVSIDSINAQAEAFAKAREELRKLEIDATRAQGFAKLFEKAAEDARRLRDDEERLLEQRLASANAVEQNLQANQTVRVNILNQEIDAIKRANVNWQNQDAILIQIEQKRAEVRDIEEEINGKLTENFTARKNILTQINDLERATRRAANPLDATTDDPLIGAFETRANTITNIEDRLQNDLTKRRAEADAAERQRIESGLEFLEENERAKLQIISNAVGTAASLYEEDSEGFRILASAQALINTYLAATAALASGSKINPIFGIISAATAVAAGLASVAKINGIEFAEGGWTGPGEKMKAVGVVHADEYVVPKRVKNNPMAQPHLNALEGMRLRPYADGGLVASTSTTPVNQTMELLNIVKNLPPQVVSVKEVTTVQRRIKVKETHSRR